MWRLYIVLTPPNIFVGFGDKDLCSTSWHLTSQSSCLLLLNAETEITGL